MTKSNDTANSNTKKLSLRRESLRELTTADLEKVAGGYCASHTPGECPPPSRVTGTDKGSSDDQHQHEQQETQPAPGEPTGADHRRPREGRRRHDRLYTHSLPLGAEGQVTPAGIVGPPVTQAFWPGRQ